MKPAVQKMIDRSSTAGVERRSFFKTLGLSAGAAMALAPTEAAEAAAAVVQYLEPPVDRPAEEEDCHRDERQRGEGDQRQPDVDREHQDDGHDEGEGR